MVNFDPVAADVRAVPAISAAVHVEIASWREQEVVSGLVGGPGTAVARDRMVANPAELVGDDERVARNQDDTVAVVGGADTMVDVTVVDSQVTRPHLSVHRGIAPIGDLAIVHLQAVMGRCPKGLNNRSAGRCPHRDRRNAARLDVHDPRPS